MVVCAYPLIKGSALYIENKVTQFKLKQKKELKAMTHSTQIQKNTQQHNTNTNKQGKHMDSITSKSPKNKSTGTNVYTFDVNILNQING